MYHFYLVYDSISKLSLSFRTFLDFLALFQLIFYGLSLFTKILGFKSTEIWIYLNLPYIVSGALAIGFWCLPGNDIVEYPTRYQNLIWKSMVQWLFFLFCNRNFLALINWEHENLLRRDDENDAYEAKLFSSFLIFENLRISSHKIWVYSLPTLSILAWEMTAQYSERVTIWPGSFWLLLITILSTSSFRVFLNFFSFQYQCIVWVVKWRKGLVIRRFQKHDSFGIIH